MGILSQWYERRRGKKWMPVVHWWLLESSEEERFQAINARGLVMDDWYRRGEALGLRVVCWPASFQIIESREQELGIDVEFQS